MILGYPYDSGNPHRFPTWLVSCDLILSLQSLAQWMEHLHRKNIQFRVIFSLKKQWGVFLSHRAPPVCHPISSIIIHELIHEIIHFFRWDFPIQTLPAMVSGLLPRAPSELTPWVVHDLVDLQLAGAILGVSQWLNGFFDGVGLWKTLGK